MGVAQGRRGRVFILVALEALLLTVAPAKTLLLDDSDNDSRLCMNVGDTITVKLSSNPSTGYSWGKPGDMSQLELVSFTSESSPSSRPGAPGFQVFTWKAKTAGKASLVLNYFRPFEKHTPIARSFRLSVTVETRPPAGAKAAEKP